MLEAIYHRFTDYYKTTFNTIYFHNVVKFHGWLNVVHSVVYIIYFMKIIYQLIFSLLVRPLVKQGVTANCYFSLDVLVLDRARTDKGLLW